MPSGQPARYRRYKGLFRMPDFLLEIGCEEIPARMIDAASLELRERLHRLLDRERLLPASALTYLDTPRRLAVLAANIPVVQPEIVEEQTGPSVAIAFKDGQPTPAAHAFAKKAGVEVSQLQRVTTAKGEYLSAVVRKKGRSAAEILAEALPKEIASIYWPKNMIELPRAALVADEIAKEAQFFSFGTNDLTQTTFGFSRDDINKVLPTYLEEGILKQDPFAVLDQEGVGQLIRMATERGRKTRPGLKVGICGEHGGEPSSVEFCHRVGLNYVSCSPFRVLTARLAAAQAAAADKLKVEGGRTK